MKFIQPFLLLPFVFTLSLWSATPVPYSGKIDIRGVNYFGEAQFAFSLHDGNGTTHWRNGNQAGETIKVTIRNGRYSVLLGGQGMNSLPPELFLNHDKLYLKVEVDMGDGEGLRHLAPDQLITATPRALVADIAKVAQVAKSVDNGAITRDMLNTDILDDLNATIEKSRLSPNILSDINRTITYDRLAPSAIHAISSASLSSITDGKIKVVPFGQTPPSGYSLYHRGKAENLNWEIHDFNRGDYSFNYTAVRENDVFLVGGGKIFVQSGIPSTWKTKFTREAKSSSHAVTVLENQIYIVGGQDQNGTKLNTLKIFDIEKNLVTEAPSMPASASQVATETFQSKIFVSGGWSGIGRNRLTFAFNLATQEWTQKSDWKRPRALMASTVFKEKIWLIGGNGNDSNNMQKVLSSVDSYDPVYDFWKAEASLLIARRSCSIWTFDNNIFVAGGNDDNGQNLDSIECYDPNLKLWYNWGKLPVPVSDADAVVLGDMVHIFSGNGNQGVLSLNLRESTSNLSDIYIQDLNTTTLAQAEVADGSVTASKIASKTIGKDQISDSILKYLKPEITTQPQAVTVYADSNVSYSVTAEGKYLTYQWKKNDSNLTGETNSTMTITDANATLHDGNYSVVVSNDFGGVESGMVEVLVNNTTLMNGLVGWWKFDETNGTVAHDSSGNGNDGNLTNGPTWTDGKIGGALSFDGVDDYVNVPSIQNVNGGGVTFAVWVKPTHFDSVNYPHIVGGAGVSFHGMGPPYISSNKKGGVGFYLGGTSTGEVHTRIIPLLDWSHVASISNGSNYQIFWNGVLEQESTKVTGQVGDSAIIIGNKTGGSDRTWFGLIDDVRIYDRALSAEEVQALYNLGQ